ncbi:MAG: hypothetical protein IJY17_07365 [Alphaproteobacteria bacterium]|nr:hypothetical protein [Alphaproteobacteria bacterium]
MTEPLLNDRFLGVENRSIVALNDLRVRFMFSDEQLFNYIKDIPETIRIALDSLCSAQKEVKRLSVLLKKSEKKNLRLSNSNKELKSLVKLLRSLISSFDAERQKFFLALKDIEEKADAERSMCSATFDFALLIGDLANKALFDKKDLPF